MITKEADTYVQINKDERVSICGYVKLRKSQSIWSNVSGRRFDARWYDNVLYRNKRIKFPFNFISYSKNSSIPVLNIFKPLHNGIMYIPLIFSNTTNQNWQLSREQERKCVLLCSVGAHEYNNVWLCMYGCALNFLIISFCLSFSHCSCIVSKINVK